jgi:UDP-glucose 4-epimerase
MQWKNKESILVLGGSGFIGSELVNILRSSGKRVTVVSRDCREHVLRKSDSVIKIAYTEESFKGLIRKSNFSAVFILSGNPHPMYSAENPMVDIELSVSPLINILKSLKDENFDGLIWYASSVAIYGSLTNPFLSENYIPAPISPYGIAKLTCEGYCKYYAEQFGLKVGILRLFSTYGPLLRRQVVFDVFEKMKNKSPIIELLSSKGDARDFSHVHDIAGAMAFLNDTFVPTGDVINIGSGKATSILTVAKIIADYLDYRGDIVEGDNSRRTIDGVAWCANTSKLKSLGYTYIYDIETGIKETLSQW